MLRVKISSLPIAPDLLNSLVTKKDLNQIFKVSEGSSIEDTGIDLTSTVISNAIEIEEMKGIEDNVNVSVNMSASSNNKSTSGVNNASGVNNVRDYSENDDNSDNMSSKNNASINNESDNQTTDKNVLQSKNIQIILTEIWKNKYTDLSVLKKVSASNMFSIESCTFSLYKGEPNFANEKY